MSLPGLARPKLPPLVRTLKDVRYVPSLKRNLISLGTLHASGFSFKVEDGRIKVLQGALVVRRGIRKNGLYMLEGTIKVGMMNLVLRAKDDKTFLWHRKLGCLNDKAWLKYKSKVYYVETKSLRLIFVNPTYLLSNISSLPSLLNIMQRDHWSMCIQICRNLQEFKPMEVTCTFSHWLMIS